MKKINELAESWSVQKGKLKKKFAQLTNKDVLLIDGTHEELLGRLQIKLGKTKEEIRKIISEL